MSVVYGIRRQTWRFEIFESARHFRIESNRDVGFEFESNLEALHVRKALDAAQEPVRRTKLVRTDGFSSGV